MTFFLSMLVLGWLNGCLCVAIGLRKPLKAWTFMFLLSIAEGLFLREVIGL